MRSINGASFSKQQIKRNYRDNKKGEIIKKWLRPAMEGGEQEKRGTTTKITFIST